MKSLYTPQQFEDRQQLSYWLTSLVSEVACKLGVSITPLRFKLHSNANSVSYTCYREGCPEINLSPDSLQTDVVAHEICHGLLPFSSLFLAEGLANYVGCLFSAGCSHLLFPQETLSQVLSAYRDELPPLSDFLHQQIGDPGPLAPGRFVLLEGRLAHAVSASVMEFCLNRYSHFAAVLQSQSDASFPMAIDRATGDSPFKILYDWQNHLGFEDYVSIEEKFSLLRR
ncbi:hypothetical protein SAMN05216228_106215 [Rhizobium tibeticum]|uniref:Uncharacterized protein n=1 Tax=Rhizobium tibeticum TaxID=501024 RepID=A0A1H8WE93_9HYPH|nr:hypothetical protein [Rhizobium tibeticum]SEI20829.1 hypothetical protein RTCCBAU85039_6482 [Rhizobium tibeticum]SEP25833.1 hypothetical protein SAMN05216228_106215 [Rhizobium tibeticum]